MVDGAVDVSNDDVMVLHSQYSTQWDSLAHVGQMFDADGDGVPEAVFYNGYRADEDIEGFTADDDVGASTPAGVGALSIDRMAETGVQGRGVLVDLHRHFGRDRKMVGYADLMGILDSDGVEIVEGDMVCLHTGFAELLLEMNKDPDAEVMANSCAVLDGGDAQLLQWITGSGLAVLIADNYAVEGVPSRDVPRSPGRMATATRALPVQARYPSGGNLVSQRTRGVAGRARPQPLFSHRAAPKNAGRCRLTGDAGGDGLRRWRDATRRSKAP